MITLAEVRDFLKTKIECEHWYCGKIDSNQERCIGIYNVQGPAPTIAIGGLSNTSTAVKVVSILVHWTKNNNTAEQKAHDVYNTLLGQDGTIGGKRVIMFDMITSEPVGVGTDDKGIFEYVINFKIIYER